MQEHLGHPSLVKMASVPCSYPLFYEMNHPHKRNHEIGTFYFPYLLKKKKKDFLLFIKIQKCSDLYFCLSTEMLHSSTSQRYLSCLHFNHSYHCPPFIYLNNGLRAANVALFLIYNINDNYPLGLVSLLSSNLQRKTSYFPSSIKLHLKVFVSTFDKDELSVVTLCKTF